ncbi:MAG: FAD-binding protein [Elusimicrobiaceae bacterium]|nr:FAD-binding protein [Elusimicrobiaceae bacterium]
MRESKFKQALRELKKILGGENILTSKLHLILNSYDSSPIKARPEAVLNIKNTSQISPVLHILNKYNFAATVRMSATNHDGACIPIKGGFILNLAALDKTIEINTKENYAIIESGVINQDLQDILKPIGFFFAPDPASQTFSTVGGNFALNAGGAKSLKYGASAQNLLGAEIVLADGTTLNLKKEHPMLHLLVKSEGTLGIITKLKVKIIPLPTYKETLIGGFLNLKDTMQAVQKIISLGFLPSALEVMDENALALTRYKDTNIKTLLITELESSKKQIAEDIKQIVNIFKNNKAKEIKTDLTVEDLQIFWNTRAKAALALAKQANGFMSFDYAVERPKLAEAIEFIQSILKKYNLRGTIVFHAGDGNFHPNIIFNENNAYEANQIKLAIKEIDKFVFSLGGTLSAEHGIAVQKRAAMNIFFNQDTLNLFRKIKNTLDTNDILNPQKILPLCENKKQDIPTWAEDFYKQAKGQKEFDFKKIKALNKIIDFDKENYTLTVGAGALIEDLNKKLNPLKFYLPTSQKKGTLLDLFLNGKDLNFADFVTGLTFVCGEGLITVGGKFVKNAAGYDLIHLMAGTQGAFGAPFVFTLRLFPQQIKSQTNKNKFEITETLIKLKKVFDKNNIFKPKIFEGYLDEETKL